MALSAAFQMKMKEIERHVRQLKSDRKEISARIDELKNK